MKTIWLWLFLLSIAAGCQSRLSAPQGLPPEGNRYEYRSIPPHTDGSAAYIKTSYGEKHARLAPAVVPVWKTRPGPETGQQRHDSLTADFIGVQKKDGKALLQIMGMTPAENDYVYQTSAMALPPAVSEKRPAPAAVCRDGREAAHPFCRKASCPQCGRGVNCGVDVNGFSSADPEWRRSDYYGLLPEQQAVLAKRRTQGRAFKDR